MKEKKRGGRGIYYQEEMPAERMREGKGQEEGEMQKS
jgi:hypothetical protein